MNLDGGLRNDGASARGADQQLLPVHAGIVFAQRAAQLHHLAGRVHQHRLQCHQVGAHIAVTHQARSAGVGRNHATDGRVGTQVDREPQAMRLQFLVQLLQSHTGIDHHAAVGHVDVACGA